MVVLKHIVGIVKPHVTFYNESHYFEMKKFFLLIACLLFLLGCRQASKQQKSGFSSIIEDIPSDNSVTRIIIDDFDPNSVLKFSDIFEDVSFVRLETNDNCLIGRTDIIVATENKYIILDSSIAKMIFVFNRDGSFSNRIGTNGNGPEDYDTPDLIAYDKYKDELLVLCYNKKTILKFKLDGTFVGKVSFDWWINSIFTVNDNAYLLYFNNYMQPNGKRLDYNIMIINESGEKLENLFPYMKETGELSPPRPKFSHYNNEIIFSPFYSSTVYSLENNKIKPKYYLDFSNRRIPESAIKYKTDRELRKILKDHDYAFNIASFETSSHVISQFSYKGLIYDCFYSKESGNTKITTIYFNDMHHLSSIRSFFFLFDDLLISSVDPESIISYKGFIEKSKSSKKDLSEVMYEHIFPSIPSLFMDKQLKDNFMELLKSAKITVTNEEIDFINSIDKMDNPILMIVKPKKF